MKNKAKDKLQADALEALKQSGFNGMIVIPTGAGKGKILVDCLLELRPEGKVWYLCDSEDNRDTTFINEMRKWGAAEWVDRVEFMCYQTSYKIEGADVALCLADEADFAMSPEYSKVFFNNRFQHLVLCSATLQADKRRLAESIRPVVLEKHLKEIEDEKIVNGANHYLVNYSLLKDENDEYLAYNKTFSQLLKEEHPNKRRIEMLQIQRKHFLSGLRSSRQVCRKLLGKLYIKEDNKILVFCGLSDQADKICKYSYHSKSEYDYLTMFDNGDIRVLSVVGKVDRGVNLTGVNNVVFESPTKSATKFTQRSGRSRRLAVDQCTDIYYLIPYFKNKWGVLEPTVVQKWVYQSTKNVNFNPKVFTV